MKYILLLHAKTAEWESCARWPESDLLRHAAYHRQLVEEWTARGSLVAAENLAWPGEARRVFAADEDAAVRRRGIEERQEFLAAFWIVDVESEQEAYRMAARASAAPGPGGVPGSLPVEVRRLMGRTSDLGL